jgi:hypothetical protein
VNPTWPEEIFKLVSKGIRLANNARSESLEPILMKSIKQRVKQLNANTQKLEAGNLNVVIFHVKIPLDAPKVAAPDIRNLDHDKIDYETLIKLNIEVTLKTNPRARVLLFTDNDFLKELYAHARLSITRLSVCPAEPMFERVATMLAYVKSKLFDQPTLFLDSDAFLLRPAHNIFANNFDIGLTHRNIHGQMPINEGVILVNNTNPSRTIKFFESYLASYLAIENSSEIAKIYKNLRRWRGGQLSINSVANGGKVYRSGRTIGELDHLKIAYLPCASHNLSEIDEQEIVPTLRNRALILHLKGPRKHWVARLARLIDV